MSASGPEPETVGGSRIIRCDAYDVAAQMRGARADLVLTSPPYWGLRTYGLEHDDEVLERWRAVSDPDEGPPSYAWYRENGGVLGLEPYPEWYIAHLVEILTGLQPALDEEGSMWVNLGDTYFARWASIRDEGRQGLGGAERSRRRTPAGGFRHDKQLLMIPARFAIAMQEAGWILRNDVIWAKPHVAPRPERDRLRLSHEHFFHFVQRRSGGRPRYYYDLEKVEDGALDVIRSSVRAGSGGHSATFHEELIGPRIRSCSPPSGVVLDPFCGTGSTVIAAVRNGRIGIGAELNPEFAAHAAVRLGALGSEAPAAA